MSTLGNHPDAEGPERRFTPVYFRIQQRIRAAIASGELEPGDKLPSESQLCAEFSTTRSTVRHALSLLDFEGVIFRKVGKGTFVAEPFELRSSIDTDQCLSFEQQVARNGKVVEYRDPSLVEVPAPAQVSERLALDENASVFLMERVRTIDGHPICLEQRYMPSSYGKQVTWEMLHQRSAHDFLGMIAGEVIPTIMVSVTARIADTQVAAALEIDPASAIIVRDHTFHDSAGKPILCGLSSFRGDVRLEFTLGHKPRVSLA